VFLCLCLCENRGLREPTHTHTHTHTQSTPPLSGETATPVSLRSVSTVIYDRRATPAKTQRGHRYITHSVRGKQDVTAMGVSDGSITHTNILEQTQSADAVRVSQQQPGRTYTKNGLSENSMDCPNKGDQAE
jgi:hypothetical protein